MKTLKNYLIIITMFIMVFSLDKCHSQNDGKPVLDLIGNINLEVGL